MSIENKHWGSTLDDFLKEEGIYDSAKEEAATRVITWQIAEELLTKGITIGNSSFILTNKMKRRIFLKDEF